MQVAAANGLDLSSNPNPSLLNNTILNNNVNNSFSAQLTMLNQQAGCERAPKYVEINYMFKPVILNTFEKGYLIFNHNKDKLEIPHGESTANSSSSNGGPTAATKTLEQINKNQQQLMSLLPKVNIEIIKDYASCYSEYCPPPNFIK